MLVQILYKADVVEPFKGLDASRSAQFVLNFLICVECFPLAALNVLAFQPGTVKKGKETKVYHSLKHFVRINDVLMDTAHTFALNQDYKEFVVIQGGNEGEEEMTSPVPADREPTLIDVHTEMSHERLRSKDSKESEA